MINQKAEAEACNFCNDDDNCHFEETILDRLKKGYFKLQKQKCDLEKCLDEALKKHRNAMDEVESLTVRNQQLRKELDDMDVLSLKVQTDLNKTIRTSVEKIKKLQNVIYSMHFNKQKYECEANELKCKQKYYQEEMGCVVGEKEKLKNCLRNEINDKQVLMCRVMQLEKKEQELRKEIERLMRISVDQRQIINSDDNKLNSINPTNVFQQMECAQNDGINSNFMASLDYECAYNRQSSHEPQFDNNLLRNNCERKNSKPIRVAVTGAAGHVAYSLLQMIGKGDVFGLEQPIILQLLELPSKMEILQKVSMALTDCAFPLLVGIVATADPAEAFKDVTFAVLAAAASLEEGSNEDDLFAENVRIFKEHAEVLNHYAKRTVQILVVTHPANTFALVCLKSAPCIPKENITSLTRLEQNRAQAQLALKAEIPTDKIYNVIIWGNRSSVQIPDVSQAKAVTKENRTISIDEAVKDEKWLKSEFIESVRDRENVVTPENKAPFAISIAKAAADHFRDWFFGTQRGKFVSMGVYNDGNYYGTPKDVFFSFPVEINSDKEWKIVENLTVSDCCQKMITETGKLLEEERDKAFNILGINSNRSSK